MAEIRSIFITLLAILSLVAANDEYKIIQTEYGAIRGKLLSTIYDAKPYYSYRGIPYAKPPLKEFRFKVCERNIVFHSLLAVFLVNGKCIFFLWWFIGTRTPGSLDKCFGHI